MYALNNIVTYFDSFGDEQILNKNIQTNFFRIQAHDSVMWGYFCIGFNDFILAGKTLTANLLNLLNLINC